MTKSKTLLHAAIENLTTQIGELSRTKALLVRALNEIKKAEDLDKGKIRPSISNERRVLRIVQKAGPNGIRLKNIIKELTEHGHSIDRSTVSSYLSRGKSRGLLINHRFLWKHIGNN